MIRRLVGGAAACGWVMCLTGGYALHWYFMPPLAYPLHGLNSLMLLVLSLLALLRHAEHGGRRWLALSLTCFVIGVVWPEFNFILFPTATLTIVILTRETWPARFRLAIPFLVVWALALVSFFVFRMVLPPAQDEARMSVAFDPAGWSLALGVLLGKGLLPFAIWQGVSLYIQPPIMPPLPGMLSAAVLWQTMVAAPLGFGIVLSFWTAGFLAVFCGLAPRRTGLLLLIVAGIFLMLVPFGVVALSAHYQHMLRMAYMQGALATAHAQAGFLTLVFASSALLALRWKSWPVRGVLALGLGALCTCTLAYNLINRDGMAANQQRWAAFALVADSLPDGARLHAPNLWLHISVVGFPSELPFGMGNYWTEYARLALGKHIAVADRVAEPGANDIRMSFGSRPDGAPIVLLREGERAWLLANRPRPVDPALTIGATWQCTAHCRLDLPEYPDAFAEERLLRGPSLPRLGFLRWLTVPRVGAYGWN